MSREKDQWRTIIKANPILLQSTFVDDVARWNALKEAAEVAGLNLDEQAQFIAFHMQNFEHPLAG